MKKINDALLKTRVVLVVYQLISNEENHLKFKDSGDEKAFEKSFLKVRKIAASKIPRDKKTTL